MQRLLFLCLLNGTDGAALLCLQCGCFQPCVYGTGFCNRHTVVELEYVRANACAQAAANAVFVHMKFHFGRPFFLMGYAFGKDIMPQKQQIQTSAGNMC